MRIRKSIRRVLSFFVYLVLLPYIIFRLLKRTIHSIFKGVRFSIRRKISLNYLGLYIVTGVISVVLFFSGYMHHKLNDRNNEIYLYVENILEKYHSGIYNLDQVDEKINIIAESENCGIRIYGFENTKPVISSNRYESFVYGEYVWDKVLNLMKYKVYSKNMPYQYAKGNQADNEVVEIGILQPVEIYTEDAFLLIKLLASVYFIGFIILWFFGSLNNRSILKPIYSMTKTAENISISNMKERIDVTQAKYELKDLAITLNEMLDRINMEYEKQKRFVSDVSHELRTPISIVNGYAGMLKRWGKEDEEILEESIEAIIDEAKNMQILVENLLTLVRADNQTLKFNKEVFYIDQMIEEVVSESLMINAKKQDIDCIVPYPVKVFLDAQMIKQMLRIFVDNAVKFTPETGKIMIECSIENDECLIKIKDTGIGIDKADLPNIFDRFYRSDESRTRDTGGHGLGLSIAKAIVLGQEGKITVRSKKEAGTEFIIRLPLCKFS